MCSSNWISPFLNKLINLLLNNDNGFNLSIISNSN